MFSFNVGLLTIVIDLELSSSQERHLKSRILLTAMALVLATATSASAVGVNGSFAFTGLNSTKNGTNLTSTTLFTFASFFVTSNGVNDFSGVTVGTTFDGPNPPTQTGVLDVSSPAAMAGFSITNASFGTFVASNTAFNMIVSQSANFMDVQLVGVFTPAGTLGNLDPTPADVRIIFNLVGSSLSSAFTLTSPTIVPEPSTYALGAIGTLVMGAVARRKRQAKQIV